MRHKVYGRKLGRDSGHRKMLRRGLITELFRHERIKTTEAKAKAIRAQAEKLITLARNRGDAERLIDLAKEGSEEELKRLLTDAQARRLLSLADQGDNEGLEREAQAIVVHAQRLAKRVISQREVLHKLFHEIAPRYVERPGGYTRLLKLGQRRGDAAQMALLELVEKG
jgi:large subunit ribosomal protein L17